MQKLAFFELSRPVQERFVEAARARATPSPLGFRSVFPTRALVWGAVSAVGLALLGILFSIGYGSLESSLAIAPPTLIVVYAALLALSLGSAVQALAILAARRALPYRPGLYLFPVGIIDASTPRFSTYRLGELQVQAVGKQLRLRHASGAHYEFDTADAQTAEQAAATLEECRARLSRAEAAGDARELATLDPLKDTGFASPFSPTTSLAPPRPPWRTLALPLAIAAALALGWGVWHLRNVASEARMFAAARAADTVEAYQSYLARGGSRAEVSEVHLPRAELEQARRSGSVSAIEAFIDKRPNSKVHAEAMAALKAALLGELEVAKKGGLAKLRALPKEHPRHTLIATELQSAISGEYAGAYERYLARSPAADEKTRAFVKNLLAWAEKHGPTVEIRYVQRVPASHDLADIAVKHSMYFTGTKSLPSQYFQDEQAKARELTAGKELVASLQKAFSPEILQFEIGKRAKDPPPGEPKATVPTLFVEHTSHLTGTYVSSNPRGVYVGVSMMFEARFEIPNGGDPLRVKHSAWTPPDMEVVKKSGSYGDVYQASAMAGHRGFNEKLLGKLFAKP